MDDISAIVGCGWGRAFTCQRKEGGKDAPRILLARVAPRFYARNQVSPTSSETILLYRGRGERDREEISKKISEYVEMAYNDDDFIVSL